MSGADTWPRGRAFVVNYQVHTLRQIGIFRVGNGKMLATGYSSRNQEVSYHRLSYVFYRHCNLWCPVFLVCHGRRRGWSGVRKDATEGGLKVLRRGCEFFFLSSFSQMTNVIKYK